MYVKKFKESMKNKIYVGIEQKEFCYIGTLDTENKVPCTGEIDAVYVDLPDGRFVVASKTELIIRETNNKLNNP